MLLRDYVLSTIPPDDYYSKRFPNWIPTIRGNVNCCFHDDRRTPSLSLSLKNGGARCHSASCGKRIGNIIHFESVKMGMSETIAARRLYREFIRPVISKKIVAKYYDQLKERGDIRLKILKEMGLHAGSIRRFTLGWDDETNRVTIPIYDPWGNVVNVRYYSLPSMRGTTTAKLFNYKKGYGRRCDLFPQQCIHEFDRQQPRYFMASEKEALLANQSGLQAVSATTGEGSYDPSWEHVFRDCDVRLVFDNDRGGRIADQKIRQILAPVARSVSSISLPLRNAGKDYADWVIKAKKDPAKLDPFIKHQKNGTKPAKTKHNAPKLPSFYDENEHELIEIRTNVKLLNHRIKTKGIVAAQSGITYSVPWKFEVKIGVRPSFVQELPISRELLRFVRCDDNTILERLKDFIGNSSAEIKILEHINVTEVEVIPIAIAHKDIPYVVQHCFYFGETIQANVPYYFELIPTTEIRTQETVGVITLAKPTISSIERFKLTTDVESRLRSAFGSEGGEDGVWTKLEFIANETATHYTRIRNRMDWHVVALLSWCSPIGWKFPTDTDIQRGWLNSLVLGDSQTGKSEVAEKLQLLFNAGHYVNAENCTFVGLVGGAIQMGNRFMLRWGRIPLADRQLVIIEELSGLSIEQISHMSDVRSSGIARLDKGGINSQTTARTRLICLSNARSQTKSLSQYLFGARAVQELVGHAEDIARFDIIITLSDKEVPVGTINSPELVTVTSPKLLPEDFQSLVQFVWSLKPEQIQFRESAYQECLDQTNSLAASYHPSIPIFKGGSGRYKLGRIAASIACLLFSWSSQKGKVIVKREHVQAAAKLLRLVYDKPSLGYLEYSRMQFDRDTIKNEGLLEEAFKHAHIEHNVMPIVLDTLIHATRFTLDEFTAISGTTIFTANQLIGWLLRCNAIRKGDANVWEITPPGKVWIEKYKHKHEHSSRQIRRFTYSKIPKSFKRSSNPTNRRSKERN